MIEKNEAAVLRYSLSGQSLHRWLEIPAWMFDPTVSMSWFDAALLVQRARQQGENAKSVPDDSPTSRM